MKLLTLLSFILIFAPISIYAQEVNGEEVLRDLKEGRAILLVRLDQQQSALQVMRRKGHHAKANELEAQIERDNRNIVLTFNAIFDYCDYRFFYSSQTGRIQRGVNRNIFLNDDLAVDPSITYPSGIDIYIVDIGPIPLENFDGGSEGLVVLDRWLNPVPDPFPYYVARHTGLFLKKRSNMELIEVFVENLNSSAAKLD